jgi:hypothetical protein
VIVFKVRLTAMNTSDTAPDGIDTNLLLSEETSYIEGFVA